MPPPGVLARVQGAAVPSYYPAFIDVRGRTCVVIGGGGFAEEKVHKLRECGAMVQVVSPDITEGIRALVDGENVAWLPRKFESGDLGGAFIAVAATGDDDANEMISKEARERNVLLNVVDVTHLCTFIAPAVARRGEVTVAVSTGGASPALARKLRESLGESAELKWADMAGVMSAARKRLRETGVSVDPQHWQCCLGDDLLDLVQAGRETEALESLLTRLLSEHTAGPCAGASQRPSTARRA
jgi:precorrin-2 dehydrogenase/sirohydrochlorin ferrochelatase